MPASPKPSELQYPEGCQCVENPISTLGTAISSGRADLNKLAFRFATNSNERIRTLLKVVGALLVASVDGRGRTACEVYEFLNNTSVEMTFISVRNVLKRLSDEGVVINSDEKVTFLATSFQFTWCDAWMMNTYVWQSFKLFPPPV